MISCSVCHQEQMIGAIICGNCGNQLVPGDDPIQKIRMETNLRETLNSSSLGKNSKEHGNSWLSIFFPDSGEILPLMEENELTIGRCSENQPVLPDVDLSKFDALENGVSRLHCVVSRMGTKTFVRDLGSSNGTTLNGLRLDANTDTSFKHGDTLSLGKLVFQLLLHRD